MAFQHFTYLLVDFFCIVFPFAFSFHPAFKFVKQWRAFFPACVITALFFILWDALFTHLEIWWFNSDYTLPWRIINLPIEEVLFFICIPYACVFTYYCVKKYISISLSSQSSHRFALFLALCLLLTGLFHIQKLYTSVSFILLAALLIYLYFKKVSFLWHFLLSFVLILPFFFLSNGLLTGSFIEAPVVMYHPAHNLGIRMFTIPFEDTFYGMLMLLMNVGLYEWFNTKQRTHYSK